MSRAPLAQRMARSQRIKHRYRTDEAYRRARINSNRRHDGRPAIPDDEPLPPVGEFRPAWADQRVRDDKGRFQ